MRKTFDPKFGSCTALLEGILRANSPQARYRGRRMRARITESCQRFRVIPANAGIHGSLKKSMVANGYHRPGLRWRICAFAGMTPFTLRVSGKNSGSGYRTQGKGNCGIQVDGLPLGLPLSLSRI
jgi:hypothetical protein